MNKLHESESGGRAPVRVEGTYRFLKRCSLTSELSQSGLRRASQLVESPQYPEYFGIPDQCHHILLLLQPLRLTSVPTNGASAHHQSTV